MNTRKGIRVGTIAALAAVIGACSGGSDSGNGTISVSLMDRSVDGIVELNITVTEFWIKPQGDRPAFQLDMVDTPVTVNLLELSVDDPAIFVDRANIPAGTYNWLEMTVDDSSSSAAHAMTDEGLMREVDIDVPSDRVRLINNFEVGPNDSVRLLFDWDVRKGLTEAVGRGLYILKPVIRVLDVEEFGSVVGQIASATVTAAENDCNADSATDMDYEVGNVIYVFEGAVDPGEIGVVDPYTTVEARDENNDGDYEYRASLMPDTYTIAATCQGGNDEDGDDGLDPMTFFLNPMSGDGVVTFEAADNIDDIEGPSF
ncbi:MAG: DUF4382 domain-containing protein [Gammaproteobacteria bacterium]|nr:DUF4382 domain-containing protein [Gammaproteobacteria bacterium]